jgi:uncharacterized protein YraI
MDWDRSPPGQRDQQRGYSKRKIPIVFVWAMRAVFVLIAPLYLIIPIKSAAAADITIEQPTSDGFTGVVIVGNITRENVLEFRKKIAPIPDKTKTFVVLMSRGGTGASIFIGEIIRQNGMSTLIPHDQICASACGLIWLAGVHRFVGERAHLGFHGLYDPDTLEQTVPGNAMVGAYLGALGLNYDAITWIVEPKPEEMHWLTPELATKFNIDYQLVRRDETAQQTTPPPEVLPGPPSNERSKEFWFITTVDLHLRVSPDPKAPDVFGPPPYDVVPRGSKVHPEPGKCAVWWGSGRGAMDADNIWCPVSYNGHAGWANAAYLGIDLQGHSTAACELYPKASGCGVPPGLYARAAPSAPLWGPAAMPSANERVWYTASMNLMFRKGPDPTSGTVFLPPYDYIPQGEMIAIPNLNNCQLHDHGAGPAVWCQTHWHGYRGWTNVLYVHGNNGQLACHIEPNAGGCRW